MFRASTLARTTSFVCELLVAVCGLPFPAVAFTAPGATMAQSDSTAPAKVPARTLASFPVRTWLENLVVAPSGDILATSYLEGKVYRISPNGGVSTFATLPGTVAGIVREPSGSFLVVGWRDGKIPSVFRISPTGSVSVIAALQGAMFPNGICHLQGTRYLIADSYRGLVWEFDITTGRNITWLADTLLARADTANPTPGVNGVRRKGDAVFLTSTQRGLLIRVPVAASGQAGSPEVRMRGLNVDDFAVGDDGSVYVATHVVNTVARIAPSGTWTTIAGVEEGVAGSTSVAIGRGPGGRSILYVTTNGGMNAPPAGGPQPGRIVVLDMTSTAALSR